MVSAVSAGVSKRVDQYATRYGLDDNVRRKIKECTDKVAMQVIAVEMKDTVRNRSAYTCRIIADKKKLALASIEEEEWTQPPAQPSSSSYEHEEPEDPWPPFDSVWQDQGDQCWQSSDDQGDQGWQCNDWQSSDWQSGEWQTSEWNDEDSYGPHTGD